MSRTLFALVLFGCSLCHASGDSMMMREEALRLLLDKVYATYGGQQHIKTINSYRAVVETERPLAHQSRRVAPPWDIGRSTLSTQVNLIDGEFIQTTVNGSAGNDRHQSWHISRDTSFEYDHLRNVHYSTEHRLSDAVNRVTRTEPLLMLRQILKGHAKARLVGWRELDDKDFIMVDLFFSDQPSLSLYIDDDTNSIRHAIRHVEGNGLIRYDYQGAIEAGDLITSSKINIIVNGELHLSWTAASINLNQAVATGEHFNQSRLIEMPSNSDISGQKIADDIWLVGTAHQYSMMYLVGEGWIAVGATAGGKARYDWVAKHVDDRPLVRGIVTHHHADHTASVDDWLELGATITVSAAHRELFTGNKYRNKPFDWVLGELLIEGLRIVDVGPNSHSESILVVWHQVSGTLFEEDHVIAPTAGPLGLLSKAGQELYHQLARLAIEPVAVINGHSARVVRTQQMHAMADGI